MRDLSDLFKFVSIGELAETTIQLLSLSLRHNSQKPRSAPKKQSARNGIDQVEQMVFQQVRDYLGSVREGFVLSVRASDVTDVNEARYLIDRVLLDWDSLSTELGLNVDSTPEEPSELESVRQQLLAFGMATVALGALPRLPANQITFPHSYSNPPTYADISAPSSPGEMLTRIEELESMIWQMMSSGLDELVHTKYGPLRRTYGFFETSAWLARKDAERFGIKKKDSTPLTFF